MGDNWPAAVVVFLGVRPKETGSHPTVIRHSDERGSFDWLGNHREGKSYDCQCNGPQSRTLVQMSKWYVQNVSIYIQSQVHLSYSIVITFIVMLKMVFVLEITLFCTTNVIKYFLFSGATIREEFSIQY